ncbi:MAG: hypothetical protein JWN76_976 [Chitinophagaceae bacterium]|nr:hypothetical protein [Chitinophagaceae bacterium]
MINEKLLQYLWQFQYYRVQDLHTIDDIPVSIIKPGTINHNQGPDFSDGLIRIDNALYAGNIELHIKTSDWFLHRHDTDPQYNAVILHVVWINDLEITHDLVKKFATVELQPLVAKTLLNKYEGLMQNTNRLPCLPHLPAMNELQWVSWKENLCVQRLHQQYEKIEAALHESKNHWEQVFWCRLARNFGLPVNAELFEAVAASLDINILAKHKKQVIQLEALLMGQANLLNQDFEESYPQLLQREYRFLQKKYQLKPIGVYPAFLRMRPANFPTIRLAQLAMLVHKATHLFAAMLEVKDVKQAEQMLNVTANDYWHYHYRFDEETAFKEKNAGSQMINNILINTIVPMIFGYGHYHGKEELKNRAIEWMQLLPQENNAYTKLFSGNGVRNANAQDSQALLFLKKNYCNELRCLDCRIGYQVLKGG